MALHWQILIALIVALLYGMNFSTNYKPDEDSIKYLTKQNVSADVIEAIQALDGELYTTQAALELAVSEKIGKDKYLSNRSAIIKSSYYNPAVTYVSWMGDLFLRALKMIIIPLILSSLISGITSIGSGSNLGRIGLKTFAYYITTSLLAILTGLFFVNLFKPGLGADLNFSEMVMGLEEKQKTFREIIIEIIPSNIFESLAENQMLSIIFFAIIFGFFITKAESGNKEILKKAFQAIFDVMMKITNFIIRLTPFGIFGIVAKVIADQDDLGSLASRMGLYMLTVTLALAIHFFITLPLFMKYSAKVNPFKHLKNMATPLLTAFSTCSSGATLPLTINAVENKSGVSNKISSFTLPLGATINMDGTALYECVAAIFIAQAYGVDLSLFSQFVIVITALLASIGAAAIPMAGLVMITVILTAVGLPLEGIGLILAVDRILDMFRTTTNVWSDSCGAVIIARSEGEKLPL